MSDDLKDRLSLIRRYIYEVVLVVLVASTGYLFKKTETNSENFTNYLLNNESKLSRIIEANTEVLKYYIISKPLKNE